jgi:hypothetical protein
MLDRAADRIVTSGVTTTDPYLRLQRGTGTHLPGNQPGLVPAVKRATGGVRPNIGTCRVTRRTRSRLAGTKHLVGAKIEP